MATNRSKYFYPPRPGSGAGTFSDNIVGLQTVEGGGLTQGNFEFTTGITEKVNRKFNVGAFSSPMTLDDMNIEDVLESRRIQATQFRVYPNYDISQVLNFSLYGSLSKRFEVSVTKIINYFPAAIDVNHINNLFVSGLTAYDISYDSVTNETYFKVNVDRFNNPFSVDYSVSATTNLVAREINQSVYRNFTNTYLDYCIATPLADLSYDIFQITSIVPTDSLSSGVLQVYVQGAPFGTTATTTILDYQIRPNDFIVDKVLSENLDEIEKFLVNRLVKPEYTAVFQVPAQNEVGDFYTDYQEVTWPKEGPWNLDIKSFQFDNYLEKLQNIAANLDSFKTNLVSRFLISDSLKEFDTLGRKVEKVFQIYGRSFDQTKQFIDGLAFMNSVSYNPSNDIPSQLLVNLAATLGWSSNFSPITDSDFLDSIFGNTSDPTYPGYARALTPTELNYAYYRNLILNAAYLFKSKGTRKSVEFLLRLIGAPDSLIEYNEYVYLADQRVNMDQFYTQFAQISGGTYVNEVPSYIPGDTFKVKGNTFTAFTTTTTYEDVNTTLSAYPVDSEGFPKAPVDTETFFFQKGAGWYETTPQHRSPDQVVINGSIYTGQNYDIQTQLQPFTYGQIYLDRFRQFPYMREGFKLRRVVDNNKSWLKDDDRIRVSTQGDYNAYYYVDNDKLVLNVKNVDVFLNPGQGLVYAVWDQSRKYDYPIPESGLTVGYPVPGGVDSTFVNPEPKKKTFFEFAQTFWENMINARNRQYITDGKTGGYPTLQSIFWKYLESEENDIPTNKYTYQKLVDYVEGIGPYWTKLVEQMIPATTIWNGGIRYENSVLHKQKFVYRRQRGCQFIPVPVQPCFVIGNLFDYSCATELVDYYIFPWLNGDTSVSNFNSILQNRVNSLLVSNNLSPTQCIFDSIYSEWYVDLKIGDEQIILYKFYTGYGQNDTPTTRQWRTALVDTLPQLYDYGFTFFLNGNFLTISSMTCEPRNNQEVVDLRVGINIDINCS